MPGTLKSDFLSRCCFFVYILSAVQIAPIMNYFPFEFITLVAVRGPITSCWYPVFIGIKPNLSFHILTNNFPLFLCLFFLHRCVQHSRNTHLGTGHSIGWCLSGTLQQTGTHCPQVWSRNVCSWLSDKTSLRQISDVQNELIFSVFVSFCFVWMFLQIYNIFPLHSSRGSKWYFVVIQFFLFLCNHFVCVQVNLRRYDRQSFSAEVGSCGYPIYRGNNWTNLMIHQPI